jgi:hypothetical protein
MGFDDTMGKCWFLSALSAMRSKLEAIPVLARAIDEPGAYE